MAETDNKNHTPDIKKPDYDFFNERLSLDEISDSLEAESRRYMRSLEL